MGRQLPKSFRNGNSVILNMTNKLPTIRFEPLKDKVLFDSAVTNGKRIVLNSMIKILTTDISQLSHGKNFKQNEKHKPNSREFACFAKKGKVKQHWLLNIMEEHMNKIRKISLFLCVVFLFSFLGACANKTDDVSPTKGDQQIQEAESTPNANDSEPTERCTYEIESSTWGEAAIAVTYPTIVNCDNQAWADEINEIIASDLYNVIDGASGIRALAEKPDTVTIDADYNYSDSLETILSIKYIGVYNVEKSAYPVNFFHTLTINLDDAKILKLSDLFVINQAFVDAFKTGNYAPYSSDLDLEAAGENIQNIISNQYTDEELIAWFSDAEVDFYMTENGVILSIEVPHVLGDHLEMAVNYENIESNIIRENPVWASYGFLSGE